MVRRYFFLFIILGLLHYGCIKEPGGVALKTRNVVLVSIDGPRWSETWGDPSRQYILHRDQDLLPRGVLLTAFVNNGFTYTSSGHTAMLTGIYQPIDNAGNELPMQPNIFQCLRMYSGLPAEKTWIISSKDKIAALADCQDPQWTGRYLPLTDCGINGAHTGNREDSVTLQRAMQVFAASRPVLTLVHFKEPDVAAHSGNWNGYLDGIRSTDSYVWQLWNFLQNDPFYAGVTTMIVTNDHGRHLDGISDGFISHGDACAGCRHIELLALGPDFRQGAELSDAYELKDLPVTIATLLRFKMPQADGRIMQRLFR